MSLEALWTVRFGSGVRGGAGVIVFETGRILGGDSCFYYTGRYSYNPRDQTLSGEIKVIRHAPGLELIFPGFDRGTVRFSGPVAEPTMVLTGHLVEDVTQTIEVRCQHLEDLPG
jgi:hypothetical protein